MSAWESGEASLRASGIRAQVYLASRFVFQVQLGAQVGAHLGPTVTYPSQCALSLGGQRLAVGCIPEVDDPYLRENINSYALTQIY